MNPPYPPRGNTGEGGIKIVKNIKKHLSTWVIFRIFPICIREHNGVSVMEIEQGTQQY